MVVLWEHDMLDDLRLLLYCRLDGGDGTGLCHVSILDWLLSVAAHIDIAAVLLYSTTVLCTVLHSGLLVAVLTAC